MFTQKYASTIYTYVENELFPGKGFSMVIE